MLTHGYMAVTKDKTPVWEPVLSPSFPLRLFSFRDVTFQQLKECFWSKLSLTKPAFFKFWQANNLDIQHEFQKENAGVFRALIESLGKTLAWWEEELKSLQVLRIYAQIPNEKEAYEFLPIPDGALLNPVTYEDKPWLTIDKMVHQMLGKYKVPITHWQEDILLTMPLACSDQNEWRSIKTVS